MSEKRYAVPDEVLAAHLEGEAVLLHMDTKDYFRLNATAACAWKGLERGLDREALVAELVAQFEVEPAEAAAELDRLLGELERRRLIVEAAAG
jgi:coenzyme PQQ synthesis protein D (PqqD)